MHSVAVILVHIMVKYTKRHCIEWLSFRLNSFHVLSRRHDQVKEEMLFEALTTRKTVTVGEKLIVPYKLAEVSLQQYKSQINIVGLDKHSSKYSKATEYESIETQPESLSTYWPVFLVIAQHASS